MGPGIYLVRTPGPQKDAVVTVNEPGKKEEPPTAEQLVKEGADYIRQGTYLPVAGPFTLLACVPLGEFTEEFVRVPD
jgi:hypothetical protein